MNDVENEAEASIFGTYHEPFVYISGISLPRKK